MNNVKTDELFGFISFGVFYVKIFLKRGVYNYENKEITFLAMSDSDVWIDDWGKDKCECSN